jgi:hypothetical protein
VDQQERCGVDKRCGKAAHLHLERLEEASLSGPEPKDGEGDGSTSSEDDPDCDHDVERRQVGSVDDVREESDEDVVENRERKSDSDSVVRKDVTG